ncbi:MAG: efflux RND transporter periplasmic adaptor subunit [Verrucomicrobia subdivision 3 bacterium]|nr:efflux RND transporter periplasmic adaptor subunit [Limisphaerales bacterium]
MTKSKNKITTKIRVNFDKPRQFAPKIQAKTIPREPVLIIEKQERVLRFVIALAVATLAVALFSGCKPAQATQQPAMQAPAVTVAPVEQREIVEWDEFTGRTEAVEAVEVRPRVSGHIQEVRFQAGQLVREGDVLFVIDPRWHKAEFERRQAEYEQAKVRLENAEREARRTEPLLTNRAISTEEAEARVSRFHEAKAAVLAAQAARDAAKLDLEYTEIRAPIDGRVSRELKTVGNYISGTAGAATMLTTIVSTDPIYVLADMDENSLLKFNGLARASQATSNAQGKVPVELQLADEEGYPHVGHIESFDNRLDPNTGSILLRAVFPNPEGRIVPGLFARIRVPLSEQYQALLVEEQAIGTDQGQKFVLTLSPTNTVEYRAVKLGPTVTGKRIVRSGLNPGDQIVVNGLQRVRPGMPVTPQQVVARNEKGTTFAKR